jgi:hypothetical protein
MTAGFAGFTAMAPGSMVGSACCSGSEIASQEAVPSALWQAAAPPVEGRTVT